MSNMLSICKKYLQQDHWDKYIHCFEDDGQVECKAFTLGCFVKGLQAKGFWPKFPEWYDLYMSATELREQLLDIEVFQYPVGDHSDCGIDAFRDDIITASFHSPMEKYRELFKTLVPAHSMFPVSHYSAHGFMHRDFGDADSESHVDQDYNSADGMESENGMKREDQIEYEGDVESESETEPEEEFRSAEMSRDERWHIGEWQHRYGQWTWNARSGR